MERLSDGLVLSRKEKRIVIVPKEGSLRRFTQFLGVVSAITLLAAACAPAAAPSPTAAPTKAAAPAATTAPAAPAATTAPAAGAAATSAPAAAGATAGTGAAQCNVAPAKQAIDAARPIPKFSAPGPAFDAKKAAGKTVFVIQETSANPFTNGITQAIKEVGDKAGIKVTDYPNQGQHTQWVQGMNTAITQKADAIILVGGGINTSYFRPQAEQAANAGIKIITVVNEDISQPKGEFVTARVGQPYAASAKLDADWVIAESNCDTDLLVLTSDEVLGGVTEVNAIKDEFAKLAPGVKLSFANAPVPEWSTKIAPAVQPAVQSNPKLKWIIPLYDSMSQFVVPAIQIAGGTGRVKVATFNGTPFVLKMMQDSPDGPVVMNVGESLAWLGYGAMDQAMRALSGVPVVDSGDEHIPLRIFDRNNVKETGVPPTLSAGYGDEYIPGYMKLWGLQ